MTAEGAPSRRFWDVRGAERRRKRFVLLGLFAVVLLAAAALVDTGVTRTLLAWPEHERAFFDWITRFGEADWILIPALIGVSIWAFGRLLPLNYTPRWVLAALGSISGFVLIGVGGPGLLTTLLKRLFGRARPIFLDDLGPLSFQPIQPDWALASFPSGHATTAFAMALVLTALCGRRFLPLFLLFAVLIALSRIVTGMHFLTDVTAGAVLGTLGALAVRDFYLNRGWLFRKRGGEIENRMVLPLRRAWRRARYNAAR